MHSFMLSLFLGLVVLQNVESQTFQTVINPTCPVVQGQCYYHTMVNGGVNACTGGQVPNCNKAEVPGFSYEACDCNATVDDGIDVIFVMEQIPYRQSGFLFDDTDESRGAWDDFLDILGSTVSRILQSGDNRVGLIRATASGCERFGFDPVLRPAVSVDFTAFASDYPWAALGTCGGTSCPNIPVVQSGTCTREARNLLASGEARRRKVIVSIRHTPGDFQDIGFNMENDDAINLAYFVVTTRPQSYYRRAGFQNEFDYGGFTRTGNNFVLQTDAAAMVDAILQANPCGFPTCSSIWSLFAPGDVLPAQQAATADMSCTYFPNGPTLTWVTEIATGQNWIRRTIPSFTSWLCEFIPSTGHPTSSPTKSPTECRGPPPPFPPVNTQFCAEAQNCGQIIIEDGGRPVVTNQEIAGDMFTTFCWSYRLDNGDCTNPGAIRDVSFAMDECCPDGTKDFITGLSFGPPGSVTEYNKAQCGNTVTNGDLENAFQGFCSIFQRDCTIGGDTCAVATMNQLDVIDQAGDFCITVANGEKIQWDTNGELQPQFVDKAQFCVRREVPFNNNDRYCSCASIDFVKSFELCQDTGHPTESPTPLPTLRPTLRPTREPTPRPTERPTLSPTETTRSPTLRPTLRPTPQPTMRPTLSPTTCKGPPPDYERPHCRDDAKNCVGGNSVIQIEEDPVLTLNNDGTTTICWSYELINAAGGACASQNGKPIRGVTFMMDECCPDDMKNFIERLDIGDESSMRSECSLTTIGSPAARTNECARVVRPCSSEGNANQQCVAVSLNRVEIEEAQSKFCVTIPKQDYDDGNGRLSRTDVAKICFERGDEMGFAGDDNVCSCVEVNFIPSPEICGDSGNPTSSPTRSPSESAASPNPTGSPTESPTTRPTPRPTDDGCVPSTPMIPINKRTCGDTEFCGSTDYTEWIVDFEYDMEDDYTIFKYCIDVDDYDTPYCNPEVKDDSYEYGGGRYGKRRGGSGRSRRGRSSSRRSTRGRSSRRSSRRGGGRGRHDGGGWRRRLGKWYYGYEDDVKVYSADAITVRLDDCCELCLKKAHFYDYEGRLQIENKDGPAYITLSKSYMEQADDRYAEKKCFMMKLKGKIGKKEGKMCIKGGPKCACTPVYVPSSCDLKDVKDPECEDNPWWRGGN